MVIVNAIGSPRASMRCPSEAHERCIDPWIHEMPSFSRMGDTMVSRRRHLIVLLLGVTMSLSSVVGAATEVPDEQFSLVPFSYASGAEYQGLQIRDDEVPGISVLIGRQQNEDQLCTNGSDPKCSSVGANFRAVIPVCRGESQTNCIDSLTAVAESGEIVEAVPAAEGFPATAANEFPADPARNLPQGATPSVWTLPGITHGGATNEYLVTVLLSGELQQGSTYTITGYNMSIAAITRRSGDFAPSVYKDGSMRAPSECPDDPKGCRFSLVGTTGPDTTPCASISYGFCALRQRIPTDVRFRLKVRVSQSPSGWFHGRLTDPTITVAKRGSGVELSAEGKAVQVPIVAAIAPFSSLPASIQALYPQNRFDGASWGDPGPNNRRNRLSVPAPDSGLAFTEYAAWSQLLNEQASASPTVWTVRTLQIPGDANGCFRDPNLLLGVVTTNSMIYSPGPPTFNRAQGTLDYRLSSPHLTSKRTVFVGSYNLAMRSSVARCLYGFSSAPISASVSVVSADGTTQVATTSVAEKDAWLYLAANGFTFSAPTVRVKLSQSGSAPAVSPSKRAPKSITCAKGRVKKTITGTKCPAGWKRS